MKNKLSKDAAECYRIVMFPNTPEKTIHQIADCVLRLSDFYIQNPSSQTPWSENFCQVAYRNYYLPLNYIRFQKLIARGQQVGFFDGLTDFIDWGCGPATASLALAANAVLKKQIKQQVLYDISTAVLKNFSDLHSRLINPKITPALKLSEPRHFNQSCLIFSYSLTELDELPRGWEKFEALVIMEPSTSSDGRKLIELRSKIMASGFYIWAPCVHQNSCPLITHSKHDWCHDRTTVEGPSWFADLENILPIKNRTVTSSYLLARKQKPMLDFANVARLTGDSLEEKGKTRQLVCKNEEREYLTWMHKTTKPQTLSRGDLVILPENIEKKSNELRLNQDVKRY